MTSAPSYRELLDRAARQLADSSDSARIDAQVLMQFVLNRSMAWLITHGETLATADNILTFSQLVDQRNKGEPIAYLIGRKEFWSLDLEVNSHVLIPRADTETLVENALQLLSTTQTANILDLGTGSGAVALALAKERPSSAVLAVEKSNNALNIAISNATRNKIENVEFLCGSWYQPVKYHEFDLIVANPPYIAAGDPHLEKGDLRFEPSHALIAPDAGFSDLSHIILGAKGYLSGEGYLIVEHGAQQADQVNELFQQAGFTQIRCHYDINRLARCTSGKK